MYYMHDSIWILMCWTKFDYLCNVLFDYFLINFLLCPMLTCRSKRFTWNSSSGYLPLLLVLYTSTKFIFPPRTRRQLWKLILYLRRYIDTGQRWSNLVNAFKYALSQTVTLFGDSHVSKTLLLLCCYDCRFLFAFYVGVDTDSVTKWSVVWSVINIRLSSMFVAKRGT